MKKLLYTILTLTLFFSSSNLFAKGFNDAVEDAIQIEGPNYNKRPVSDSSSHSDTCTESLCDAFCDACTSEVVTMWVELMSMTRFRQYPFANGNDYHWYHSIPNSQSGGIQAAPLGNDKFTRWSISDAPFYMGNNGISWGNDFRFDGMILCIGPYIENMTFNNKDDNDRYAQKNGNLRIGGQIAIFQSDPLSASLICQWSHWYGDAHEALQNQNGVSYGFQLQNFAVKPFHLDWRFLISNFDKSIVIYDSVASAGFLTGRFEIFAGWKYLRVGSSSNAKAYTSWNGVTAGARVYF